MTDEAGPGTELEQLRAQVLQLKREVATYKRCFAESRSPIQLFDADGYSIAMNPAQRDFLGVASTEVGVGEFNVLTDPFSKESGNQALFERAFAGESVTQELQLDMDTMPGDWNLSGRRHFAQRILPVLHDGALVAVAAILDDFTDQRTAEAAARDDADRYQHIVETLNGGVWTIDANEKTDFVNEQMASMLGRSVDDMVGRSLYEFMDDDAREWAAENVERRKQSVREVHEFPLRHADGRTVWTEMATSPIEGPDGSYMGALALVYDITARKQAERDREQLSQSMLHAQKLESLGVLAGGIAHDFNNLLVGVLGNASLAKLSLPSESKVYPMLSDIERAAQRAAEVARQMLAYSGRGTFLVEPLKLNMLVEEMTKLLSVSRSKKAMLEFQLDPALPTIDADATQMRQLVMNLVTNASEALGDRGGAITVRTGVAKVSRAQLSGLMLGAEQPAGRYVYLEVSDNGCGMDEDTCGSMFDPFFSTKFTGRGLGLAAVVGIVRGHRGAIEVESTKGEGTRVRVLVPCAASDSAARAPQESSPVIMQPSGAVLLVDDEQAVRSVAASMLKELGFRVVTAMDGVNALEVFDRHRPEIAGVLLDVTMPRMDGREALDALRKRDPAVRVVMMSGYNEDDATRRIGAANNVAAFLQKPFDVASLKRALARLQQHA